MSHQLHGDPTVHIIFLPPVILWARASWHQGNLPSACLPKYLFQATWLIWARLHLHDQNQSQHARFQAGFVACQ